MKKFLSIRGASRTTMALLAGALPAWAGDDPFIGPYLQNVRHDSVVIKWESEEETSGVVEIGEGGRLDRKVNEDGPRRIHDVEVKGLKGDTLYSYRVRWSGKQSDVFSFRTMPPAGARKFRLAAYGDSRSNPEVHAEIARRMLATNPEIVLNTGDLVTDGTKKEQWKPQFFDPLRQLASRTPVITCLGNHEKDSGLYYDYFHYPGNEAWFSYRWANVHFIVLDTQKPYEAGTEQHAWLEKELAGPDADWRVVFFHVPMYSCHPSREIGGNRWAWQDLFDRGGVDLVLTGHDHYYQRTHRIGRAWDSRSKGTYHITTAGGGATLYPVEERVFTAKARSAHHFVVIDFDGMKLTGSAFGVDGELIDTFEIDRARTETTPFVSYEILLWERDLEAACKDLEVGWLPGGDARVERVFELPPYPLGAATVAWEWVGGSSFWDSGPAVSASTPGKEPLRVTLRGEGRTAAMYPIPELEIGLFKGPPGSGKFINRTFRVQPARFTAHRSVSVLPLGGPIVLDGKMDEPAWREAAELRGFTRDGGRFLSRNETLSIAHDASAIYIGAKVTSLLETSSDEGSEKRDERRIHRHDESWTFVFTAPTSIPLTFFLSANFRGTKYDSLNGLTAWDPVWDFAASLTQGGWEAEARIPWTALGFAGPPIDAWKVNFLRRDGSSEELSEWLPTYSPYGTDRQHDGGITFEKVPAAGGR